MQMGEHDVNVTFEALSSRKSARGHSHGHLRSVAEGDERQPILGNCERAIFRDHMSCSNIESKHDALCVHLLRLLNRSIRDTLYILTDNGTQFVNGFFGTICYFHELRRLTTAVFDLR